MSLQPAEVIRDLNGFDFLRFAGEILYKNEAINSMLLGLAENTLRKDIQFVHNPIFLRIVENGETLAAALQTPPLNLVLSPISTQQVDALIAHLIAHPISIPGVLGPETEARYFAQSWSEKMGLSFQLAMAQKIYELRQVIPAEQTEGRLRKATEQDTEMIAEWMLGFFEESLPHDPMSIQEARLFAQGSLRGDFAYVWEASGVPVCMTHLGRPTRNGMSVRFVYTPPNQRKKGYASALVAELSQQVLNSGKKFCVLYTDAQNPTSNRIYQNIGYKEIAKSNHFVFKPFKS